MATSILLPIYNTKNKSIAAIFKQTIDYFNNPQKTEDFKYLSSFGCAPETADEEFLLIQKKYYQITGNSAQRGKGRKEVLAYQIRQAFRPGEITPEKANQIGYELAIRFTKGKHPFVVATHTDKAHIHNHIIFSAVELSAERKFNNFLQSGMAVRKISDVLCMENGLSIVEHPSEDKSKNYGKWLGESNKKKLSFQDKLRIRIDEVLAQHPASFEDFLKEMQDTGWEVKLGKQISFRSKEQKRFTRLRNLGAGYTEQDIRERIAQSQYVTFESEKDAKEESKETCSSSSQSKEELYATLHSLESRKKKKNLNRENQSFQLLIDLDKILQNKNSAGYLFWAKKFNLKQMAQTFQFIQSQNINTYEEFQTRCQESIEHYHQLASQIKKTESEIKMRQELKSHIINYMNTREVYEAYKNVKNKNVFYREHEGELLLHAAAKKAFNETGLRKLPSIKTLNEEVRFLYEKKQKYYREYHQAEKEMKEVLKAKANIDTILHQEYFEKKPKEKNQNLE